MGSYLKVGHIEINSKSYCGIIIDCLRAVDTGLKNGGYHLKNSENLTIPEYYETDEDGDKFGCGNWKLHRKAVALVVNYLKLLINDEDYLKSLIQEKYAYSIEKTCKTEDDVASYIESEMPQARDTIQRCFDHMYSVWFYMTLHGKKWIKLKWI